MANSVKIVVVADDLTGALDAVGPFAAAGMRCVVATNPDHLASAFRRTSEVISVSTNSRELPAASAATLVQGVAGSLKAVPVIFKKIDSRLKGNVAAEVSALAQALGMTDALICPAIPAMGRVVENGQLRGFGVAAPIDVAAILADVTEFAFRVPDAQTDADIDAILAGVGPDVLLIGARGLSAGLA